MLFNSTIFFLFFAVVYAAYRLLPRRGQNALLLVASYVFYGWWDPRFLSLIALSTVVDYVCGLRIHAAAAERTRRSWLLTSIAVNLGILGFFKYFDFFAGSLAAGLEAAGLDATGWRLDIVLPVGISFYTFQTMSYTIDIYRGRMRPTRHFLDFALFVAFFPQLVAGPIERAAHLLPQMQRPRRISAPMVRTGLALVVWGYFKKVFVADNMAMLADSIFARDASDLNVWYLSIGALAFAFQIYGDFSGYSDIARGICKLMGFDLMVNFRAPYAVTNPSAFWRHWHISLSTWLRDYLYIPMGGSRGGPARTALNLMGTMLLGGLWHGAAWNFVLWGAYHGALLVIFRPRKRDAPPGEGRAHAGFRTVAAWLGTFVLTLFGWLLFRANLSTNPDILDNVFRGLATVGPMPGEAPMLLAGVAFFSWLPMLEQFDKTRHEEELPFAWMGETARAILYAFLVLAPILMPAPVPQQFIYFQF